MGSALFTLINGEGKKCKSKFPNYRNPYFPEVVTSGGTGAFPLFSHDSKSRWSLQPPSPLAGALVGERQGIVFETNHVATNQ